MRPAIILVVAIGLAGPALAQQPAPPQKTFTITVTGPQVEIIGAALGRMPFVEVAALIAELQRQIGEQNRSAVAPESKDK